MRAVDANAVARLLVRDDAKAADGVSWHHALPVGDEDCYEACRHVRIRFLLRDPAKQYHVRDGTCGCFDQSGTHGKHGEFATRGDRAAPTERAAV
jgi:hypothetical protein